MKATARVQKMRFLTALLAALALAGANPARAQSTSGPIPPQPGQTPQGPLYSSGSKKRPTNPSAYA